MEFFVLIFHRNLEVKYKIFDFRPSLDKVVNGQWKKYDSTHTEEDLMYQLNDL